MLRLLSLARLVHDAERMQQYQAGPALVPSAQLEPNAKAKPPSPTMPLSSLWFSQPASQLCGRVTHLRHDNHYVF